MPTFKTRGLRFGNGTSRPRFQEFFLGPRLVLGIVNDAILGTFSPIICCMRHCDDHFCGTFERMLYAWHVFQIWTRKSHNHLAPCGDGCGGWLICAICPSWEYANFEIQYWREKLKFQQRRWIAYPCICIFLPSHIWNMSMWSRYNSVCELKVQRGDLTQQGVSVLQGRKVYVISKCKIKIGKRHIALRTFHKFNTICNFKEHKILCGILYYITPTRICRKCIFHMYRDRDVAWSHTR